MPHSSDPLAEEEHSSAAHPFMHIQPVMARAELSLPWSYWERTGYVMFRRFLVLNHPALYLPQRNADTHLVILIIVAVVEPNGKLLRCSPGARFVLPRNFHKI
jgi:hypothetical protein